VSLVRACAVHGEWVDDGTTETCPECLAETFANPEWMVLGCRKLATDAEELLQRHEREAHDGEPCLLERVNMVAFLAHRLGVRSVQGMAMVAGRLSEYEEHHHHA
jgi:hypothetical protein